MCDPKTVCPVATARVSNRDLSSGPKGKNFLHPVCGPRVYFSQLLTRKTEIYIWLVFSVTVNSSIFYVSSKRRGEPASCLMTAGWRRHREGRARAPRVPTGCRSSAPSPVFSEYSNISVPFICSNHSLLLSSTSHLSEAAAQLFA